MGVGVGEASLSPAAYSLIADYFRPERRSTAISAYSMGIYIGSGLAFVLGGLVVKYASGRDQFDLPLVGPTRAWQLVFFLVGLPGLLISLLVCTVKEPKRQGVRPAGRGLTAAPAVPLREAWVYLRDNSATLLCLNLGVASLALSAYGASTWIPTFFIRDHGWPPARAGVVFGLVVAVAGTLGVTAGGRLADRLRLVGRPDAELRVALVAAFGWLPFGVLYPLVTNGVWAAVVLAPAIVFSSAPFGVAPAAVQRMMPNAMRAQATALYLFVINLIGLGLGPTAVALVTDHQE
jgi:MFS family permease